MALDDELKKMFANNCKTIPNKYIGHVDPYLQWVKLLSYFTDEEQERFNLLKTKKVEELSLDEINEVVKYKEQERMLNLLNKFNARITSKDEWIEVEDFINNQSLTKFIKSKLSIDELEYAKTCIESCKSMSKKDLKEYVESHKRLDVYDGLSLVEVLVLYIATNYYYNRCEYESEIKLGAQLEENRNMKYRSMINASKGIPLI